MVNRFVPVTYSLAPKSHAGAPYDRVTVRRRRYDPLSRRLDVKLFGPTWFGFSPMRGNSAFVLVGVQRLSHRSRDRFTRGELSVRIRLTLRILPPFDP